MLAEERFARILQIVEEKRAVKVGELTELLGISESTVRRDLTVLDEEGRLHKVHGGATALEGTFMAHDVDVSVKMNQNRDEKARIAAYAAALVNENDFVYLDAGTTTEWMAEYLTEKKAVYVTNGISLAKTLAQRGFEAYIIAGRVKSTTEAVIGAAAAETLGRYNFTKGFFGTNGIDKKRGYTTPDIDEARTKSEAMERCKRSYVLADPSKFSCISAVTFAKLQQAELITTACKDNELKKIMTIWEVDRL